MSINHYSSDTPETTLWWTTQQHHQNPPIPSWHPQQQEAGGGSGSWTTQRFNLNIQDEDEEDEDDIVVEETTTRSSPPEEEEEEEEEKEAMFEKPLTPSDVGKLNRLVIPKQHAERYFPLDSEESKGLLLSFEDESGKCWRFRYSYWNSSQSYVLTKGWSRYVKDKRLDAGDVVLFHRHKTHSQRFFITWRRRHTTAPTTAAHLSNSTRPKCTKTCSTDGSDQNGNGGCSVPVGWTRGFYPAHPYPTHHHHPFPFQTDSLHAGGGTQDGEKQSTGGGNSTSNSSTSRVLRLFGVNMECQPDHTNNNDSQNSTPDQCSSSSYNINMSSTSQGQGGTPQQFYHHHHRQPSYSSSSNPHHHMVRQQPY